MILCIMITLALHLMICMSVGTIEVKSWLYHNQKCMYICHYPYYHRATWAFHAPSTSPKEGQPPSLGLLVPNHTPALRACSHGRIPLTYLCMYIRTYVCMYVYNIYVYTYVSEACSHNYSYIHVCIICMCYIRMMCMGIPHLRTYVCMYIRMYVCAIKYMYIRMCKHFS